MTNAKGKIALITGANKGIGFEVAKQLGSQGCVILLGARDAKLGQEAAKKLEEDGVKVHFVQSAVTNPESIKKAAAFIKEKFGKLNILVNNAGIFDRKDGPPALADLDAVERTMNTNFLGHLRVTQAMLPLLKLAEEASIVNVSSGLASLTLSSTKDHFYTSVPAIGYCASKAALNMFTVKLAHELKDTKIKVNSSDPGYTATDMNGHSGHQTIEEGAAETVRLALLGKDGATGTYSDSAGVVPW
jgi:NAD(P)-dependent dehydrogenase (short-subunit alcohol dehydrogenase family)